MRQRWGIIGLVAIVSFFTGGWLLQRGAAADGNVYQQARLFDDVLSHVSQYYVDSLSESSLYRKATDGLLAELHDPYSVLLVEEDYKQLTETTTGNYGGLGIQIDVRDGWITVVAPLPDTPAEQAGVETGDRIIEVDGKSTEGWNNERAVNALRGEPGSKVRIKVERAGIAEPVIYDLTRARIHLRSVPAGTLFPGGIGYISLNPVSESSAAELQAEVSSMMGKGMKAMIFDLRGNPGGLLDQGVKVADLFLDSRQEIVSTRGRAKGSSRQFVDEARQVWPELPIVVLVNEGSASAAEIIAGAMQDHDRAVVVGTPTFGKGLVQTLFTLGENVALKLTTARWFTPSGRTIQRVARNEEEQFEQAAQDSGRGGATVSDSSASDSLVPVFRTDGGRIVRGGGGIVPDIVMRQDSTTPGERAFIEAVGAKVQEYRDVMTVYALDLKRDRAVTSEDFTITPAMKAEVVARLRRRGVVLSPEVVAQSGRLLEQNLSYEIARYVFGRPAEFRRRSQDDRQMQTALEMLRKAPTPAALLDLASASATAPATPSRN